MKRRAEINFRVDLDEDKMPSQIKWDATDAENPGTKHCEAMLISLWDSQVKNTLGIDLWTKNMLIDDMNIFIYQTLKKLADTYSNATNDPETADIIYKCASDVANKLKLLNK